MINYESLMMNMQNIINFTEALRNAKCSLGINNVCTQYSLLELQNFQVAINIGIKCYKENIDFLNDANKKDLISDIITNTPLCNKLEDFIHLLVGNSRVVTHLSRFLNLFYVGKQGILGEDNDKYYKLLSNNVRNKLYCDCCGEIIVGDNGAMIYVESQTPSKLMAIKYGHHGLCKNIIARQMYAPERHQTISGLDVQLYDADGLNKFIKHISDKEISKNAISGLSRVYGNEIMSIINNNNLID